MSINVRFEYPGAERTVVLYMNSKDLNNINQDQRAFMGGLPGIQKKLNDVHIPFNGNAFDQAVENVKALEDWADGE